ncbi:molybdenum cofactor guanylyltransferase [Pedobacter rhizosphaerae]|uniref:Molybdenum cofactor guanylyltransferase n=1 Tax=Pedobacter rhizosphaerae TaxID=390241 RepID=A0A1H9MKQ7_9SPHI|nr:molybdenum cofactor guanylyltransferase [Pedobacter rhizosphaerae]SER24294.1 molybdenum cofactor guanylyltransferase [Pedobacter rhizosphaerae]
MEISGLILCGGESKRMGNDKGLLLKQEEPWVKLLANLFRGMGLNYHLSIKATQMEAYSKFFNPDLFIVDAVEVPGPLRGIFSAHLAFPETNWLILACDMIEMTEEAMQNILKVAANHPDYDYWIYKNEIFYEPFCGIYSARGLKKLIQQYREGSLERFSMQSVFKQAAVFPFPVGSYAAAFKNLNQI